ncbi:MAG: hypothetical protein QM780_06420 [Hyphomicrobium sp.]|uniref:hypothetical protein n=1 Tax=Hyphomicrobium sp. TaxID=82 RepID=UPI0039E63CC7
MKLNIIAALGAALLLALAGVPANAGHGGGGGGHFSGGGFGGGGGHFGGGGNFAGHSGGGGFSARSFRSGPSFGGNSFRGQSFRSRSFDGPRMGRVPRGDRAFRPGRGPGRGYANYNRNHWNGGKNWRHHHGRYWRRYPIYAGYPYYDDYYYDDYYVSDDGDDCAWLYRRAIQTGSSYWWRRYRACEY